MGFILWYLVGLFLGAAIIILFRLSNKLVKDRLFITYAIGDKSAEVLNPTNGQVIIIPFMALGGPALLIPLIICFFGVVGTAFDSNWASKPFFKEKEKK